VVTKHAESSIYKNAEIGKAELSLKSLISDGGGGLVVPSCPAILSVAVAAKGGCGDGGFVGGQGGRGAAFSWHGAQIN
jgi:hypothetical protein